MKRFKEFFKNSVPTVTTTVISAILLLVYLIVTIVGVVNASRVREAENQLNITEGNPEARTDISFLSRGEKSDSEIVNQSPTYMIKINTLQNYLAVYAKDEDGNYTVPFKTMVCSTGSTAEYTPVGMYTLKDRYSWRTMASGMYAKYSVKVEGGMMIQSVPSFSPEDGDINPESFNQLGKAVTMGSIWLTTQDAEWIYYNCDAGTQVLIYGKKDLEEYLLRY